MHNCMFNYQRAKLKKKDEKNKTKYDFKDKGSILA